MKLFPHPIKESYQVKIKIYILIILSTLGIFGIFSPPDKQTQKLCWLVGSDFSSHSLKSLYLGSSTNDDDYNTLIPIELLLTILNIPFADTSSLFWKRLLIKISNPHDILLFLSFHLRSPPYTILYHVQ